MQMIIAVMLPASFLGPGSELVTPDSLAELLFAQEPQAEASNQPAWRPDSASEVLLMVQGFYAGARDLEAKFEQSYWNPTFAERKTSSGKLKVKKPSKMVWDYSGGEQADYYTNGETLWMVEHDTRQVIKTDVSGNPEVDAAVRVLFDGDKLLREFKVIYAEPDRVKRYGDADHYVLRLRPKQKATRYKGLVLVVHATTGRVDGMVVYNTDGSSSYYQFSNIRSNVGLGDKLFDYELPKNYVETVQ